MARAAMIGIGLARRVPNVADGSPRQRSKFIDVTATVAQTAAKITGQTRRSPTTTRRGSYVGFDTHTYPGDATMKAWKKTPGSPYKWVGYYLPAPCHNDKSWTGKRDSWQRWAGASRSSTSANRRGERRRAISRRRKRDALRKKNDCKADLISRGRRKVERGRARPSGRAEGFPHGSWVFLDLERMQNIPPAMRDYYKAWTARMLESGSTSRASTRTSSTRQQIFTDVKRRLHGGRRHDDAALLDRRRQGIRHGPGAAGRRLCVRRRVAGRARRRAVGREHQAAGRRERGLLVVAVGVGNGHAVVRGAVLRAIGSTPRVRFVSWIHSPRECHPT